MSLGVSHRMVAFWIDAEVLAAVGDVRQIIVGRDAIQRPVHADQVSPRLHVERGVGRDQLHPAPLGQRLLGGALLIGNFGDGAINAFDPASGNWLGYLTNAATGLPFALPGLWGLKFGNDGSGGDAHTLYYTAGIAGPAPGGGAALPLSLRAGLG